MLPPFIIEQIRRREEREAEERRRRQGEERPRLEIPVDANQPADDSPEEEEDRGRGVVILDLG
jgi:hypothetical protein